MKSVDVIDNLGCLVLLREQIHKWLVLLVVGKKQNIVSFLLNLQDVLGFEDAHVLATALIVIGIVGDVGMSAGGEGLPCTRPGLSVEELAV